MRVVVGAGMRSAVGASVGAGKGVGGRIGLLAPRAGRGTVRAS